MYADAMKNAHRVLRALGGYRGPISSAVRPQSILAALRAPILTRGADGWPAARRVIAAAQAFLVTDGLDPGPIDGFWGPSTDAAFHAWRGDPLPDRRQVFGYQDDMADRFGPPGGPQCTAGRVRMPWRTVLAWDPAVEISTVSCHVDTAESAQRVLDAVARIYDPLEIEGLGLHLFGGCFNNRPMRGGSALSTHAWGVAWDFDPARNRLQWGADRARLAQPDAAAWWDAWEAEGWTSLGRARNFDWMHVQAPAP